MFHSFDAQWQRRIERVRMEGVDGGFFREGMEPRTENNLSIFERVAAVPSSRSHDTCRAGLPSRLRVPEGRRVPVCARWERLAAGLRKITRPASAGQGRGLRKAARKKQWRARPGCPRAIA